MIEHRGVTIIGYVDLPSRLAPTASQLYGTNLTHLLGRHGRRQELAHRPRRRGRPRRARAQGRRADVAAAARWSACAARKRARSSATSDPAAGAPNEAGKGAARTRHRQRGRARADRRSLLAGIGLRSRRRSFVAHLTVFVLACFVGWQVVWNVTPALHTPLMSVTNAISGIILVGGMLQISGRLDAAGDDPRRQSRCWSPRSTSPAASWSPSACCGCFRGSAEMPAEPRHRRLPGRGRAVHPEPGRAERAGDRRGAATSSASSGMLLAVAATALQRQWRLRLPALGRLRRDRRRASARCWPRAWR